jgi:putative Mn2+ efflux pump MntP
VDLLYIFGIAIGLNFDDLAVNVLSGLMLKQFNLRRCLLNALAFAFPQTLFIILGWLGGFGLQEIISSFAAWVALILLSIIGGKMIYEGVKENQSEMEEKENKIDPLNLKVMILLGFATSFDALAVGVSLGLLNQPILWIAVIIFVVTFAISFLGMLIGIKFHELPSNKLEILGGVVLIVLGILIFAEDVFSIAFF